MKTMRHRFVTATLLFGVLGLLAGCAAHKAAGSSSAANPKHDSTSNLMGASIDAQTSFPLWLPEPGASSEAELLPRAEEARQRALDAASNGDWPTAVAAFKEAITAAPYSPALMFNLGLAYQRGGWSVPAAMWYQAYLAALPGAANASEVRAEIRKLVAQSKSRSLWLLEESERLAEALPATPSSAGAKSLRQRSLETIAAYAYMVGLKDRGDGLVRKALALPGAITAKEKREYPDKHGLYGASYSWDATRTEDIIEKYRDDYSPEIKFKYRIYAWGMRGDTRQARKIVDAYPPGVLSDSGSGVHNHDWITQTRAYEILEIMRGRSLDAAKKFDPAWYMGTLMRDLQNTFWDGRPDIAQRLARRAVEHCRKFRSELYSDAYWAYIIPSAALGDREAIVKEMSRWKAGHWSGDSLEVTALFAVATMPPLDAQATIMEMVKYALGDSFDTFWGNSHDDWEHSANKPWIFMFPEAAFAFAISRGDPSRALKYLETGDPPSSQKYQDRVWRALRFAVATGNGQLALDLSEKSLDSLGALLQLNRLAANPGASDAVREGVSRYAASVSGGWRPANTAHARNVRLHLKHARHLSDETEYALMPANIEKTAKEQPEKLPEDLAGHALVLWMGAMAAPSFTEYTYQGRDMDLASGMLLDLTGKIKRATVAVSSQGGSDYFINVDLSEDGTQALEEFTQANIGGEVGMTYKGKLVSVAIVREPISGGHFQIGGSPASVDELKKLASELSGK
ncbi:MAG: SecDF P1 head subdomain-containing protein [Burkholderiales bacterium]